MNLVPVSVPVTILGKNTAKIAKQLASLDNCSTRLALGVGALLVEPSVDYFSNRNLSKEDRTYSVVKTCSKIIIGTATGVIARFVGQSRGRESLVNLINNNIKPLIQENCKPEKLAEECKRYLTKSKPEIVKAFKEKKIPLKEMINAVFESAEKEKKDLPAMLKTTIEKIQSEHIFIHEKVAKDMITEIVTGAQEVKTNSGKYIIESGEKLAVAFGDSIGVATAALFCLTLDIPLMNFAMNKVMSIVCPEALAKHQQKGGH